MALEGSASSEWWIGYFGTAPGRSFAGPTMIFFEGITWDQIALVDQFPSYRLDFWWSEVTTIVYLLCWFYLKGFLCPPKGFLIWCAFVALDQKTFDAAASFTLNQTITVSFAQRVTIWPWIMRCQVKLPILYHGCLLLNISHHLLQH